MFKGQVILQNLFSFAKGIEGKTSKKMHRAAAMLTAGTLVFSLLDVLPEQVILAEGSEENFAVSSEGNHFIDAEEYFSESAEENCFVDAEEYFSENTEENRFVDAEEYFSGRTEGNRFVDAEEYFSESTEENLSADGWMTVSLLLKTRLSWEKNDDGDQDKDTKENQNGEEGRETNAADREQKAEKETNAINHEQEVKSEPKAVNSRREAEKAESEEISDSSKELADAEHKDSREKENAEISGSDQEYQVLLKLVQAEAGGCDAMGKILVANVVLNRVKSEKFPDSISGVVYEKSQFSPAMNGTIHQVNVSESTKECVARALNGEDYSQGALYFMNRGASQSGNVRWFDQKLTYLFQHDQHEFFK